MPLWSLFQLWVAIWSCNTHLPPKEQQKTKETFWSSARWNGMCIYSLMIKMEYMGQLYMFSYPSILKLTLWVVLHLGLSYTRSFPSQGPDLDTLELSSYIHILIQLLFNKNWKVLTKKWYVRPICYIGTKNLI